MSLVYNQKLICHGVCDLYFFMALWADEVLRKSVSAEFCWSTWQNHFWIVLEDFWASLKSEWDVMYCIYCMCGCYKVFWDFWLQALSLPYFAFTLLIKGKLCNRFAGKSRQTPLWKHLTTFTKDCTNAIIIWPVGLMWYCGSPASQYDVWTVLNDRIPWSVLVHIGDSGSPYRYSQMSQGQWMHRHHLANGWHQIQCDLVNLFRHLVNPSHVTCPTVPLTCS
jgi:hypothetical protein